MKTAFAQMCSIRNSVILFLLFLDIIAARSIITFLFFLIFHTKFPFFLKDLVQIKVFIVQYT